jgi:diadenosine tetraphosphate (Ap4A) HIT family hydrolase
MTDLTDATFQFVDIDNARVGEQRQVMAEIISAGHCPFCPESLTKYHTEPWIIETTFWLVTKNRWPYENTRHHLLLIYRPHAEKLSDLDPEAGRELFEIVAKLEQEMDLPGGGLSIRFGSTQFSAGSVNHLHAQLIVPDATSPNFKPVRIKLGKDRGLQQSP